MSCPSTIEYEYELTVKDGTSRAVTRTETRTARCAHPIGHAGPHSDGAWFEWDGEVKS